jgi:hypothetical protein
LPSRNPAQQYGALKSWANTVNRSARTAPARAAGPQSVSWHEARLGPQFADATPEQRRQAAEAAHRAYFAELSLRAVQAKKARRSLDDATRRLNHLETAT